LIQIDGKGIGATPKLDLELPAGKHEIVLLRPDTSAVRLRKTITLAPGDRQRITAD